MRVLDSGTICCRAFVLCMDAEERGAWLEATGKMEGCSRGWLHSASSESRQERGLHKAPAQVSSGPLQETEGFPRASLVAQLIVAAGLIHTA